MVGSHHQLNAHVFEQTLEEVKDRAGMLQSMGLQRVRHDLATEQQQQYILQKGQGMTYFLAAVKVKESFTDTDLVQDMS